MRAATARAIRAAAAAAVAFAGTWAAAPARAHVLQARSIAYLGALRDHADLQHLRVGTAGFWFPQFGAPAPVTERPTRENARAALPAWVAPLNHWSGIFDAGCTAEEIAAGCLPGFSFRSFSQDGPARSAGGFTEWSALILPSGESGLSGAIVDPATRDNRNNTVNRIQLRGDVPRTFYLGVLTDNTARAYDPARALVVRGNIGPVDTDVTQVEPSTAPDACDLVFNAEPDVHVFRVAEFRAGDYLKLRLGGTGTPASFGGLLFDVDLRPRGSLVRPPVGGLPGGCRPGPPPAQRG